MHKCSTEPGSSGCPIINIDNNKVIGIHKGAYSKGDFNLGTILREPIEKFKDINLKIKNNKNQFNSNENKKIRIYPDLEHNKSKDTNKDSLKNNKQSNKFSQIKEKPEEKDNLSKRQIQEAKENGFVLCGLCGSGKTTLLNAIIGKKMGEAQNILEELQKKQQFIIIN